MRTNNSKDCWKLLKSKNKREEPDIPITSLYDIFKNLNAAPVTQEEILKCVKKIIRTVVMI
jgi:hypothetical protein